MLALGVLDLVIIYIRGHLVDGQQTRYPCINFRITCTMFDR